ncbi:hypothetical protein V6N13_018610 [Hibiscus sabdariffa]
MADALVSALVSTVLNNLDSLFREEIGLAGSLKTELESLQRTFTTIQAVLHDAEQKQWKSEAIKIWLRNLQQAAYDLEDVLDDFKSEARKRGSKVSTFFSLQNPLLFRLNMARRVKTAREKVEAIAAEKSKFFLRDGAGESETEPNNDRETSSLVKESKVIGRADEKGEMVRMILSNATHRDDPSVYAICGMGGLGKTTIAQLVYNDQNVAKAFDMRAWVCVSDDFDVKRLTKAILESIEGKSCGIQELDPLQRRLVEKLVRKRFLIVLDDVWNACLDKWDRLNQALQSGGRGSAVIVTTRLEKVALMMATGYECCVIEPCERLKIPKTARHLLVHRSSSSTNIMDLSKLPPLRSLILSSNSGFCCTSTISSSSNFMSNQKLLKVLDCGLRFSNTAFKSLKQLRYLCLRNPSVESLPESISSLHNLQTLNLHHCHCLQMLPKGLKNLKNLTYLDFGGCYGLISMPVGLGQLTCLRKLSKFVVGKDNGGGIDELKELALQGELSITGLCNVKNSEEAKNANLIRKQNLRSLRLSWHSRESTHHQHGNDEEILNALQPHSSLKKLCITDYQGLRFPNWMMDLLLPNLVEIELHCERSDQLPPLGKLCFLKVLTVREMNALKCMDSGFYGDKESSFPSLEVLKIDGAQCLEEWTTMNGGEHFPLLSSLTIRGCPMLVKSPVLQSLKELDVSGANVILLNSLMMNTTDLTSLHITWFRGYMDLPDGLLRNHKNLKVLKIGCCSIKSLSDLLDNLSSLKELELYNCSQLESLPTGLQNLCCLEYLILTECESLVTLPVNGLQGLSSLSSLSIRYCKKFTSLPESIQHLSSLRYLHINWCERLSSLPNEIQHLTSLSQLEIEYCYNIMSLPQGVRSLTALQTLRIIGCPHLGPLGIKPCASYSPNQGKTE